MNIKALEIAARRYADATAEIRRLTERLAVGDERGLPELRCRHPLRNHEDPYNGGTDCRKWTFEGSGLEGDGRWECHRDRSEWCPGCIEVQRVVDERRAARKRRGSALTAIANIARARPGSHP